MDIIAEIKLPLITLVAVLTGCVSGLPAGPRPLVIGDQYVAAGSSFAAGAGILPSKSGPKRCGRSALNYASLLAAELKLRLNDQTCNGATSSHLLARWNELPAQLDAVGPETRLVTITVGGNDLNYSIYLIAAGCRAEGTWTFEGNRVPCPSSALPRESDYLRLEANLRRIVRTIKMRAPGVRVVFVQYVALVPDRPCDAAQLPPEKAAAAREIGRRLAEVTSRAARLEGGEVLRTDRLSLEHRPCDAEPWSAGTKSEPGEGMVWHPTSRGHAAIAQALAQYLKQ